jgi:hypothetical protein
MQEQLNEPTSYTSAVLQFMPIHGMSMNKLYLACMNKFMLSLSKPIIRPWEEIGDNKHRTGIIYEKEVTFHISDYIKPIQFQSVEFLQEVSTSPIPIQDRIPKCQHCHRVGHMEDQCFDLHPCEHCAKHNHPSDRCSKSKKPARVKNHYGWITFWQWSSSAKKIYQSYRRINSQVLTSCRGKISSSHLVPDRGGIISMIDSHASSF